MHERDDNQLFNSETTYKQKIIRDDRHDVGTHVHVKSKSVLASSLIDSDWIPKFP